MHVLQAKHIPKGGACQEKEENHQTLNYFSTFGSFSIGGRLDNPGLAKLMDTPHAKELSLPKIHSRKTNGSESICLTTTSRQKRKPQ
jgi:hypothetical protein